ncbi:MAG: 4-hydroxy-tetrahydrodipicolinate reductase [Oscillospiraceae bacterium]|nr:4-hydroxy-tetrahydrodipicolinate reductase [Oscillospiraceae bacterium]
MKLILSGFNGKLGRAVAEAAASKPEEFSIAAGIEINPNFAPVNFPVFLNIRECEEPADAIIDFSHHSAAGALVDYANARKIPAVICTTGHTPEEMEIIRSYSDKIALFLSANMSLGAHLTAALAKKAAALLAGDFDIEIIEKHHNQKIDAPSGTALMIADEISSVFEVAKRPEYIYERQSSKRKRNKREIGIHSIRGGTIVGEHEVIFAGANETISISHSAQSREMFAAGALAAARFLRGRPAGLYGMKELVSEVMQDE